MGNGMRGMHGTRGMFTMIPGNLLEDSGECSHFSIPGNVQENSGECYQCSGECLERFRRMFRKIAGNAFNFKINQNHILLRKSTC